MKVFIWLVWDVNYPHVMDFRGVFSTREAAIAAGAEPNEVFEKEVQNG